ncbi:hypothetical protein LguiB_005566 [Lonicera macranthoides]
MLHNASVLPPGHSRPRTTDLEGSKAFIHVSSEWGVAQGLGSSSKSFGDNPQDIFLGITLRIVNEENTSYKSHRHSGKNYTRRYAIRVMTISSPTTSRGTHHWENSGTRDLLCCQENSSNPEHIVLWEDKIHRVGSPLWEITTTSRVTDFIFSMHGVILLKYGFTLALIWALNLHILPFIPSLTSLRSEYFVRATLNDSSQVNALTAIIQAFGWRNVVPIYVDDDFGEGIIPSLIDALNEIGTHIPYRRVINPSVIDQEIIAELYKLMIMQTRVFVLHMTKSLGSRVLNIAQEVGMMSEGYVWIVSNGITSAFSLVGTSLVGSFKGVIGVKPYVPRSKMIEDFILQ